MVKAWHLRHGVRARSAQAQESRRDNLYGLLAKRQARSCVLIANRSRYSRATPHGTDWMPDKDHPSYLDMLVTLRKVLWTDRINLNSTRWGRVRELLKTPAFTLCAAA